MFQKHFHFIKYVVIVICLGMILLGLVIRIPPNNPNPVNIIADLKSTSRLDTPDISPQEVPFVKNSIPMPLISAEAAVVIDQATYSPLFSKNGDVPTYPASTTKIATAVIVIEQYNLNQILSIPADINSLISGSMMNLIPNDQLTVLDLLKGMLINSGNDAAYVLAINHPDNYSGFVEQMNKLVTKLHLTNTVFENPIGFDSVNQYISPRDLAILADYAYQYPIFQQIVNTQDETVSSAINPLKKYELHNTNTLLGKIPGVNGIKTGWTSSAQGVLVSHVIRENQNIIVVVMRSKEREVDTTSLINWVYDTYDW